MMEIREQVASQDYDCDGCDIVIPDETRYVRVAFRARSIRRTKHGKPPASRIEKYHPDCWLRVSSCG
jgi:hypothetical protein